MNGQPSAVKRIERGDGTVEYHVIAAEGWDDCESLARFIVKEFSADVLKHVDGICSREWVLRIDAIEIGLKHHDDMGNYFFATTRTTEADALVKRIADELSARLSGQE